MERNPQQAGRRRQKRVPVIGPGLQTITAILEHQSVSVDPDSRLDEYFALKVHKILPSAADFKGCEEGEGRRTSLPITLQALIGKEYIIGPKMTIIGTGQNCDIIFPLESQLKPQHFRMSLQNYEEIDIESLFQPANDSSPQPSNTPEIQINEAKFNDDTKSWEKSQQTLSSSNVTFCLETCLGDADILLLEDLAQLDYYEPDRELSGEKVSKVQVSKKQTFATNQIVWQMIPIPLRNVTSLKAFSAARSGSFEKLRDLLEQQREVTDQEENKLNIFDINREERQGHEQDSAAWQVDPLSKYNILLHVAVARADLPMVQLLLSNRADPNKVGGSHQRSALHIAVELGLTEILICLLQHGGDIEIKDINHLPPIALARSHEIRRLLLYSALLCSATVDNRIEEIKQCFDQLALPPNVLGLRHKSALHLAAIEGYSEICQLMLDRGADINLLGGSQKRAPLHYATAYNHFDIVQLLLSRGARVDLKDNEGNTPINLCTKREILHLFSNQATPSLCDVVQSGDIDAAEELLRCNKNVEEYIDQRNSQLNTPLHIACQRGQLGMVKLLKEFDVNVNVIGGPDQLPAICIAAREGYAEIVEFLIAMGADTEGESSDGHFSVRSIVEDLLDKCDKELQEIRFKGRPSSHLNPQYYSRLKSMTSLSPQIAIEKCEEKVDTIRAVYDLLFTPAERLLRAFQENNSKVFRERLHDYQKDLSVEMLVLPQYGISLLAYLCEMGERDYVKWMLQCGAKIPDSGASEELPLHIAADRSYLSICELLLAANVDVNIRSSDTLTTALHEAAMNDNLPIIKLLIKYHAKKDITNIHGETPFDLSRNKECRKILAHGAQELLVACSNGDIEMLDTLRMRGYDPITQTFLHNWTTLHEACQWGHLSIVKRLLAQNIHVNAKGGHISVTPLHLACMHGHNAIVIELLNAPDIRVSISSKDFQGRVPYEVALNNQIRHLLVFQNPIRPRLTPGQRKSIDQNICIVCRDNSVEVQLLPCKHQICCYDCAEKCKNSCPMCRDPIKNVVKIAN